MKKLKFIFFALLFSTLIYSCTDDDYQSNTIENTQATGDEDEVDNGSKE